MSQRITIDPVTRIEGHLRIDCEIENGVVSKAWASGTMWRGMEEIVKNRDPRDAWMIVQRICGVCTTTHAISSVRAAESALNIDVPVNAQYIRNIILAAHTTHDHIVHFYQLSALDWVDITSALKADPEKASAMLDGVSSWHLNSAQEFTKVQNKIKDLSRILSPAVRQDQGSCRQRSVRYFRQWLLGAPGNAVTAGGQPDCGRPLSAGAGMSA
ncbi:Uptake hydrogenase large subunit [Salmonella enterica subsp. enterica serovar Senftenberg str. A4-543]|uniref:hydrogenase (acceptor) n=1 Tax=Salmonella enterica subsp. enterica serovar Senftenberg str. A4-543 TaxID=913082 RepID=G5R5J8_SALSE|nr:Uptake hydrogenase large subunit [Salmonella enterica subsp. enterica serovar Senftenberg str. A4-543]